jgi:hypothetical protein
VVLVLLRIPSLIVGALDRAVFTPYEMRRHRRGAADLLRRLRLLKA